MIFLPGLVVVRYLDIKRIAIRPAETDPPLVVDTDAEQSLPIPVQALKPIPRRYRQILQRVGAIQDQELPQSGRNHPCREPPGYSMCCRVSVARRHSRNPPASPLP